MQLFLDSPFEEAFASLTALHTIMKSGRAIPTYGANTLRAVALFHASYRFEIRQNRAFGILSNIELTQFP